MRIAPGFLLAAILLVLGPGENVRADCMLAHLEPFLVNTGAELGPGGGVLVSVRNAWASDGMPRTQPSPLFPETIVAVGGRRPVTLHREVIAPNLVRYVARRHPFAATYQVVLRRGEEPIGAVRYVASAQPAVTQAPEPTAVQKIEQEGSYGEMFPMMRLVQTAPVPPDVVAYVLNDSGGPFVSAVRARQDPRGSLILPVAPGHCGANQPAGTRTPPLRAQVEVRYVDSQGRLGPPAAIRVTQGGARSTQSVGGGLHP